MVSTDRVKCLRREKRQAVVYQYQKDCRYFAQIADSLKEAGAKELAELGAEDVRPEFSGIHFRADKSTLYRINYLTRLLIPIHCIRRPNTSSGKIFLRKTIPLPYRGMFPTAPFRIQSMLPCALKMRLPTISKKKSG
jgi:hypothetical protein